MAGHTPGPWEAVKANWDHTLIRHALPGDAHVPGYIAEVNNIGAGYEANARLIAAAPELLSIARRWAALDAGDWHVERHASEKRELLADTRAAIARATEPQA